MMTYDEVLHAYPTLTDTGFEKDGKPFAYDKAQIDTIVHFLPFLFRDTKKKTAGSYGMKHYVEETLGSLVHSYVSNGELILAMLSQGYEPKILGRNATFRVDYRLPTISGLILTSNPTREQLLDYVLFKEELEDYKPAA